MGYEVIRKLRSLLLSEGLHNVRLHSVRLHSVRLHSVRLHIVRLHSVRLQAAGAKYEVFSC